MTGRGTKFRTVAAAAAGSLLLAACGAGPDRGDGGATGASRSAKAEDAMLRFAQCMRREGVEVGDPGKGGVVRVGAAAGSGGEPQNPARFRRAEKKCGDILRAAGPPPELSAEDRAEFERKALAFARCMRKQGIDMPDPQIGSGGAVRQQLSPASSPQGARFRAAEQACRDVAPQIVEGEVSK